MIGKRRLALIARKKNILTLEFLFMVTVYLLIQCLRQQLPLCDYNPENLTKLPSKFTLDLEKESLDAVEERFVDILEIGGLYSPIECKAPYRVCVITPYRNREEHLPIFLKNLHLFLMNQNLEYKIVVVEQIDGREFNRAALFNVGFVECNEMEHWDYFVFHDVDLIPTDNRNIYICPKENPRHLTVAIEKFYFRSESFEKKIVKKNQLNTLSSNNPCSTGFHMTGILVVLRCSRRSNLKESTDSQTFSGGGAARTMTCITGT